MEKKLSDYIQYYIGCRCLNTWFDPDHGMYNNEWVLKGIETGCVKPYLLESKTSHTFTDSIKPILRRLSDIKDEEAIQLTRFVVHKEEFTNTETYRNYYGDLIVVWGALGFNGYRSSEYKYNATAERCWSADQFNYLIKQGFDLFQLIENNLAVDESILLK